MVSQDRADMVRQGDTDVTVRCSHLPEGKIVWFAAAPVVRGWTTLESLRACSIPSAHEAYEDAQFGGAVVEGGEMQLRLFLPTCYMEGGVVYPRHVHFVAARDRALYTVAVVPGAKNSVTVESVSVTNLSWVFTLASVASLPFSYAVLAVCSEEDLVVAQQLLHCGTTPLLSGTSPMHLRDQLFLYPIRTPFLVTSSNMEMVQALGSAGYHRVFVLEDDASSGNANAKAAPVESVDLPMCGFKLRYKP